MSSKINKKHDRDSFFKYMPVKTAKSVLTTKTLRWSSPLKFNDPFDVPREVMYDLSPKDLVKAVKEKYIEIIRNPPDDISVFSAVLRDILEKVKNEFTKQQINYLINDIQSTVVVTDSTLDSLDQFQNIWRNAIKKIRLLCLTESPSHIAMWYHYADKYKGVALEFKCIDSLESDWFEAERIQYPNEKALVYTLDGWVEYMILNTEVATKNMIHNAIYTKSSDWSYEKEWRIFKYDYGENNDLFTDIPFDPLEVASLYLGPDIDSDDRDMLINLVSDYPDIKIYSVKVGLAGELIFNTE